MVSTPALCGHRIAYSDYGGEHLPDANGRLPATNDGPAASSIFDFECNAVFLIAADCSIDWQIVKLANSLLVGLPWTTVRAHPLRRGLSSADSAHTDADPGQQPRALPLRRGLSSADSIDGMRGAAAQLLFLRGLAARLTQGRARWMIGGIVYGGFHTHA